MSGGASVLPCDVEISEVGAAGADGDAPGPRCWIIHIHDNILARLYDECPR